MQLGRKEEMYYDEGGETLEKVAPRMTGCPITGRVESEVQRNFEGREVVPDIPAHGRGVGLDDLSRSPPSTTIL